MKKTILFFLLLTTLSSLAFTQKTDTEQKTNNDTSSYTGFYLTYTEGVSIANVTRIVKQTTRSNFVWNDSLVGLFVDIQTGNCKPFNYLLRIAAYYPYHYTFNDVEQKAKQTILYAADAFIGPYWELNIWHIAILSVSPGVHYFYQLKDRFQYSNLGIGAFASLEFPISKGFTVVANGIFSYDYGNLGSNAKMQPVDFTWEWQFDIGVRWSKKKRNQYPYFKKS